MRFNILFFTLTVDRIGMPSSGHHDLIPSPFQVNSSPLSEECVAVLYGTSFSCFEQQQQRVVAWCTYSPDGNRALSEGNGTKCITTSSPVKPHAGNTTFPKCVFLCVCVHERKSKCVAPVIWLLKHDIGERINSTQWELKAKVCNRMDLHMLNVFHEAGTGTKLGTFKTHHKEVNQFSPLGYILTSSQDTDDIWKGQIKWDGNTVYRQDRH